MWKTPHALHRHHTGNCDVWRLGGVTYPGVAECAGELLHLSLVITNLGIANLTAAQVLQATRPRDEASARPRTSHFVAASLSGSSSRHRRPRTRLMAANAAVAFGDIRCLSRYMSRKTRLRTGMWRQAPDEMENAVYDN